MIVDYGLMKTTKANLLKLYDIDTIWACCVFCPCWNSLMFWWSLRKAHMYLYVITLQLSKFANQTYTWCMVIQTHLSKLQTFQSSLMLLQTHQVGLHMIRLLIWMMAHNTWLFKLWDILTWSIILIPHWSPLCSCSQWMWIIITSMKAWCIATCDLLIIELKHMYLNHELMDAFENISTQYWLEPNCVFTFATHLSLIKRHYCTPKKLGTFGSWVLEPLSRDIFDLHTPLFKLTLKILPLNCGINLPHRIC